MNAVIKKGHSSLDIGQYVIKHCAESGIDNSLTPMQVLKLVYLCHSWMLGLYGRPLISDRVEAWTYGPVIPKLYQAMRTFGGGVVDHIQNANEAVLLDDDEVSVIHQVCRIYGPRTGMELSQLTHKAGSPWEITWSGLGKSGVISNDVIEDHYRSLSRSAATATA